ncbi:MAG: hypothetical protein MUC84_10860 [Solirubrobacteraceae bacterium]|nr:hypothetical protein [Solirubrobacteraceae bacterium]
MSIPIGTRSSEPVSTGIATSSANSPSLRPSSLRIGRPTIANITQTAKKIVKRTVAMIRTRTASGETWWAVLGSRVARAGCPARSDPGSEGSATAAGDAPAPSVGGWAVVGMRQPYQRLHTYFVHIRKLGKLCGA